MLKDLIMALIALFLSLLLVPGVGKLAIRIGAVDKPNARKVHTHIAAAIIEIPAAKPSNPSIRLTALIIATIQIIVTGILKIEREKISPVVFESQCNKRVAGFIPWWDSVGDCRNREKISP